MAEAAKLKEKFKKIQKIKKTTFSTHPCEIMNMIDRQILIIFLVAMGTHKNEGKLNKQV